MKKKSSIAILLATYNSEKYLNVQIDSVLNQTHKDFILYIRDDGSTDSTISIVEEYGLKYDNIILVNDTVKGRGAKGSFMWLLEQVEADYYMFCDHDDYWLPQKVELTLAKMKQTEILNPDKAVLIHTDLKVVDENLDQIHNSFFIRTKLNVDVLKKINYLGVCNCATGCTIMINNRSKTISLPMSDTSPMHDWWIAIKVAGAGGVIDYVDQATILYRQHANNVVGARDISTVYFVNKILNLLTTLKGHRDLFPFHRAVGYGGVVKFYYYKILYTLRRNM